MTFRFEKDVDELTEIRHRLMHARDLDIDEMQELYYRKNYLESGLTADEQAEDYGDEE